MRAELGRYFAKASSTKTLIIVDLAMLAENEDVHNLLIMDCLNFKRNAQQTTLTTPLQENLNEICTNADILLLLDLRISC